MSNNKINPSLAIGVVIENSKREILFVEEARDKYYEKVKSLFGLPSGKVEWDEKIEDGLKREMREELNIEIKPIGLIGVYQYLRSDSQCIGLAFKVELSIEKTKIQPDRDEIKAIKWISVKDALKMSGQLRDGAVEVLEDYSKNQIIPFEQIHIFDFRKN